MMQIKKKDNQLAEKINNAKLQGKRYKMNSDLPKDARVEFSEVGLAALKSYQQRMSKE